MQDRFDTDEILDAAVTGEEGAVNGHEAHAAVGDIVDETVDLVVGPYLVALGAFFHDWFVGPADGVSAAVTGDNHEIGVADQFGCEIPARLNEVYGPVLV